VKLELSVYVLTADGGEFATVREEVLLQVVSIVDTSGTGFAQPTTNIPTDARPIASPAR